MKASQKHIPAEKLWLHVRHSFSSELGTKWVTKQQDISLRSLDPTVFPSGPRVTLVIRQAKFVFSFQPVF